MSPLFIANKCFGEEEEVTPKEEEWLERSTKQTSLEIVLGRVAAHADVMLGIRSAARGFCFLRTFSSELRIR